MRGLSPHTVAMSCVMPAARASAASSLARMEPDIHDLVLVCDGERDLRSRAVRTRRAIPDGLGVVVHVADEDVVVAIDACEVRELDLGEARLRAAEAAFARALAESCEERGHGLRVPVPQRPDGQPV